MKIIEIVALENGAHRNQTFNGVLPNGWAVIPNGIITANFPFGDVEVEEINGVMTVTKWTPGEVPAVEDPEPTIEEKIAALKAELESTDYKIIKCSEASLVGEELPYDIVALHAERQALRNQINELERSDA